MNILDQLPENIKAYIESQQGTLLDGYVRFLGEEEISEISDIVSSSPIWNGGICFATTAFGDVFAWEDGYVFLYKFTDSDYNVILSGTDFFFENIEDEDYQADFFDIGFYQEAVEKYGKIGESECFTLEPIPALGGARELKYVHVGDMKTYLSILMQF